MVAALTGSSFCATLSVADQGSQAILDSHLPHACKSGPGCTSNAGIEHETTPAALVMICICQTLCRVLSC